jgi:4-diphosphocytidyl-2C-methyl-D-erythritol kinase
MAGQLGSDPAFFLGPASAIVSGLGDVIELAALDQPIHLVLMLPPLHCNTGAVYRTFDALSPNASLREVGPGIDPFNDLAEPACEVEPRLRAVRARCQQLLERPVHVTGSGAAMFALAASADEAQALAARITDIPTRPVCTL